MEEEHEQLRQRVAVDVERLQNVGGAGKVAAKRNSQLLAAIGPWLSNGKIVVSRGNQRYFDLLEARYPIGLNRIEWRGVQPHETVDVLPSQDRVTVQASDELTRLRDSRSVVEAWLLKSSTSPNDPLLWIGDAGDLNLETKPSVFLECFPQLFASGQHSYVFPPSCDWCINYTMEGQLFWGRASDSRVTGCVDSESM
jgi:hypothetical protein